MTEVESRDAALLGSLPVAVYRTDAEGRITFCNEAAAQLWGREPALGETQWCGAWKLYWPDGRPMKPEDGAMAQSLREGRPVRGVEAVLERPDGSRVTFLPHPSLLKDGTGRVVGGINVLVEIAERRDAALEAARLAAIVSSSDDAIVSKTLDGVVTSWNDAASRIFGYSAEEMIGERITRIIPPELRSEEDAIIARLRRGERIEHFDTVRMAKDGTRIEISLTVSPIRDRGGRIVGASKVARDISERKRHDVLQRTLFDELNHRVRNTLATVQALAVQTLRGERSLDEARTVFHGRLTALNATHGQLSRNSWSAAALECVLRETLLPYGAERIATEGPPVMLSPRQAVTWGLLAHELAANAAKYGSLSVPGGAVSVTWRRPAETTVELVWRETGGPSCARPARKGFGTRFIERASASDLAGGAIFDYRPDGLAVTIRATLD